MPDTLGFRKRIGIAAATYWDALHRCGIEDRVNGYGRILDEL